jgi:hypothetical protein
MLRNERDNFQRALLVLEVHALEPVLLNQALHIRDRSFVRIVRCLAQHRGLRVRAQPHKLWIDDQADHASRVSRVAGVCVVRVGDHAPMRVVHTQNVW